MIGFRDLVGRLNSWLRPAPGTTLAPDDPNLRVVAAAGDATRSATSVLEEADELDLDRPAVLRHHLELPADRVDTARGLLDEEGWSVSTAAREEAEDAEPDDSTAGTETDPVRVFARRVQDLSATGCARENSRMVGLAQRLGGCAHGWDVLQPPATPGSARG